ncbi:putative RNA-directed DNA polymerase, partial [Tanacetum coccineum]
MDSVGRLQISFQQGTVLHINFKGKSHKVSVVEETRDFTNWEIQERSKFNHAEYEDIGNKENEDKDGMQVDEENGEDAEDSCSENDASSDEHGEEGYKHTPVIVSGCHSRMRDEGTSFSGETKVSETFNGEAVWPKEKRWLRILFRRGSETVKGANIVLKNERVGDKIIRVSLALAEEGAQVEGTRREKETEGGDVKGRRRTGKKGWVKAIIKSEQPDIVGLQETKCNLVDDSWVEDRLLDGRHGLVEIPMGGRKFTRVSDDGMKFMVGARNDGEDEESVILVICLANLEFGGTVEDSTTNLRRRESGDIIRGSYEAGVMCFGTNGDMIARLLEFLKRKRKEKEASIFKVDFEKAYDSINWKFLLNIIRMGFGTKWYRWVETFLRSSTMSVLVNGSPSEEFGLERGVRQGDPLSPFLFILAAKGLNAIVSEAVEKGIFTGVKVGENKVVVSHLQYADDTIFLGEWNKDNAKSRMCILKCFEEVSGLRVNYNKSKLYGIGVEDRELSDMARWMGCGIGEFPFMYLGLSIGENMRRINDWKVMVDKFKSRLADWKAKTMSFGGRLTLVKSVIGSLPLYYFLMFRVPLSVIKQLERIRKKFFWGGAGEGNKLSWVKWEFVIASFGLGGLNIGSLRAKNLALLGKWWWRFKNEGRNLWVNVIKSIHGASGG